MNSILIDNKISLLNSSNGKKFNLNQAKVIWFILGKINDDIIKKKCFISKSKNIKSCDLEEDDIKEIEIDKLELRKTCFPNKISNKRLFEIIKSTQMTFEFLEEDKIFNLYTDLDFSEIETIYLTPTNTLVEMLHCNDNHFEVNPDEIFRFKSVNSIIFYQWFKSNKYIIQKYNKQLIIDIDDLKEKFLTNNNTNDFLRRILNPAILEYNIITKEQIKNRPIKDGTKISKIEFLL